jgi:hypothetical protein
VPEIGPSFGSIGRFAHSGEIVEVMIIEQMRKEKPRSRSWDKRLAVHIGTV